VEVFFSRCPSEPGRIARTMDAGVSKTVKMMTGRSGRISFRLRVAWIPFIRGEQRSIRTRSHGTLPFSDRSFAATRKLEGD
jgi:hypothetical protein